MIRSAPEKPADARELAALADRARAIRIGCLESIASLGVGHVGGSLSIADILAILYFRHLRIDAADPRAADRDMFVLSKGHAGPALYAALAEVGFIPHEWLSTLNRGGTRLPSHADRNMTPGVDMTTGSLGQGFSAAAGIAAGLAMEPPRADGTRRRCWAIIGDGESDEGQVWEAASFAAHYQLDNFIAFTDANKFQIDGETKAVMDLRDLCAKWEAFGWYAARVDGHDLAALDRAILQAREVRGRPCMIVLDTVKAKGLPGVEGRVESHNMPFLQADFEKAKAALEAAAGAVGGAGTTEVDRG